MVQKRSLEQYADLPLPQAQEQIGNVPREIQQEGVQQYTSEQTVVGTVEQTVQQSVRSPIIQKEKRIVQDQVEMGDRVPRPQVVQNTTQGPNIQVGKCRDPLGKIHDEVEASLIPLKT